MGITSSKELAKSLNTCVTHISCVLVFYITVTGLTLAHQFGKYAAYSSYCHELCLPPLSPQEASNL